MSDFQSPNLCQLKSFQRNSASCSTFCVCVCSKSSLFPWENTEWPQVACIDQEDLLLDRIECNWAVLIEIDRTCKFCSISPKSISICCNMEYMSLSLFFDKTLDFFDAQGFAYPQTTSKSEKNPMFLHLRSILCVICKDITMSLKDIISLFLPSPPSLPLYSHMPKFDAEKALCFTNKNFGAVLYVWSWNDRDTVF